jgi:hypothetical protein
MRIPTLALLTLMGVLTAGCATTPQGGDHNQVRTAWNGVAYEEVVARWGAPSRSTRLPDGRDAHTWVSETVQSRAAFWPSIGIFGGSGGVGFGTGVTMGPGGGGELLRCERTLFFQNGRVVEQSWNGPADFCAQFNRG